MKLFSRLWLHLWLCVLTGTRPTFLPASWVQLHIFEVYAIIDTAQMHFLESLSSLSRLQSH